MDETTNHELSYQYVGIPTARTPPRAAAVEQLPFWDTYALRLTCRHFASITPKLGEPPGYQPPPRANFNKLWLKTQEEGGDLPALCDEFNKSWLAKKSNVAFSYMCNPARREDCGYCGEWNLSDFPFMDLDGKLQKRIISHVDFYTAATLCLTSRHLREVTPPIEDVKEQFEKLYNETVAAGGNIDHMCNSFNMSWFAMDVLDASHNRMDVLEKGCSCGRRARDVYDEGCEDCGWEECDYIGYGTCQLKY